MNGVAGPPAKGSHFFAVLVTSSLRVKPRRAHLPTAPAQVRYVPELPKRTICDILRTIADIDKAFTMSVYHPATLKERSRSMHRRLQWSIARRLILAVLVALPTFIIRIV